MINSEQDTTYYPGGTARITVIKLLVAFLELPLGRLELGVLGELELRSHRVRVRLLLRHRFLPDRSTRRSSVQSEARFAAGGGRSDQAWKMLTSEAADDCGLLP